MYFITYLNGIKRTFILCIYVMVLTSGITPVITSLARKKWLCFFNDCEIFWIKARKQRKLYKHLKKEIVTSQKMVYRVKAGFVRDRPLTAPDLSMYQSSQRAEERPEMTTKSAYDRINHRINSGRSRCKILNPKLCLLLKWLCDFSIIWLMCKSNKDFLSFKMTLRICLFK